MIKSKPVGLAKTKNRIGDFRGQFFALTLYQESDESEKMILQSSFIS